MKTKLAILPGDGIGPEVMNEAIKVLDAVADKFHHDFKLNFGNIGGSAIDDIGTPLPEDTLELCKQSDAVLFGAVGGPKWDDPKAQTRPEDGILEIRKKMKLFANLRPVKIFPALINSSPLKPDLLQDVDLMVVRELTGGLYFGKPKKRWSNTKGRQAVDTLKYSEKEIDRIVRVGFELAKKRRKKLTSTDKANVLATSRLWREITNEVASEYPEIETEHIYADNLSMQIILNPARFDVIVGENTFGDIISDEAAVLTGSLGMLPSASLSSLPNINSSNSRTASLYEPIHGSAPDIAGNGVANPLATILAGAMLLRHSLGLESEAAAVEVAAPNASNGDRPVSTNSESSRQRLCPGRMPPQGVSLPARTGTFRSFKSPWKRSAFSVARRHVAPSSLSGSAADHLKRSVGTN